MIREPSPYQAKALGLNLTEYYRRLLIVLASKAGGVLDVSGEDLLAVSAADGLILRFSRSGVALHTESAAENWEAHVGTPGSKEPEGWTVQEREHLVAAKQPQRTTILDDFALAQREKARADRKALHDVVGGEGPVEAATRMGRIPWYAGNAPVLPEGDGT